MNDQITEFISNPENFHECDKCPFNKDSSCLGNLLPCGKSDCRVDIFTES